MRNRNAVAAVTFVAVALGASACGREPLNVNTIPVETPRHIDSRYDNTADKTSIPQMMKFYDVRRFNKQTGIGNESKVTYRDGRATFDFVSGEHQSAVTFVLKCIDMKDASGGNLSDNQGWMLEVTSPSSSYVRTDGSKETFGGTVDYPKSGRDVCADDHQVTLEDNIESRKDIIFTA